MDTIQKADASLETAIKVLTRLFKEAGLPMTEANKIRIESAVQLIVCAAQLKAMEPLARGLQ